MIQVPAWFKRNATVLDDGRILEMRLNEKAPTACRPRLYCVDRLIVLCGERVNEILAPVHIFQARISQNQI